MKNGVVKITYHYSNGATLDITREHTYEKHKFVWAKECRRSEQEQLEYDNHIKEINERLKNIDPSIFPKNLFSEEE